jgi:hypothetical protein
MGKKDKHGKKDKTVSDLVTNELTKKERKALKNREAELEVMLAAKLEAEKAAKKEGKKAKAKKVAKADEDMPPAAADRMAFLRGVIADLENESQKTRDMARKELAKLEAANPEAGAEVVAEVAERVKAKKAARKAGLDPDAVDRDDEAAVKAYNEAVAASGGPINLITSNAELKREHDRIALTDIVLGDNVKPKRKAGKNELVVEIATETGREFVAGPVDEHLDVIDETVEAVVDAFATVDDNTPKVERDSLGRPRILNPATGKVKSYTRVTTYIDNLEDRTQLEKWKLRTLLEGVVLNETEVGKEDGGHGDYYVGLARQAMHERDVALRKLDKADRKGKLETGERGVSEAAIVSTFKSTLNDIAHEALELGGVHEKAQKGTDLHALCELYDMQGMGAINELVHAGKITPADHQDVVAYASAMLAAGIKVLECEQFVVLDDLGVGGTLDRLVMAKVPGSARAVRMVADIKTGRVDYGIGKIAQQIGMYSRGKGYDPANPKARRDLKANQTKGLLIHLPQGTATCTIHVVDLTLGAKGNKLSSEVRAWRNEGKKAIDLKTDLAAVVAAS